MELIFNWIFVQIGVIIGRFVSMFLQPINDFLIDHIPNLSNFFLQATNFLNNYVFKGLQFVKMVVLNICNISQSVWFFFLSGLLLMIFISINGIAVKFAYNIWKLVQGTNGGK